MDTPTKALLIGATLAATVCGVGYVHSRNGQADLVRLEAQCQREIQNASTAEKELGFVLECKGATLANSASSLESMVDLQANLASAYQAAQSGLRVFYPIAAAIVITSAIPWLWYFLLRRLRELREAVVGK